MSQEASPSVIRFRDVARRYGAALVGLLVVTFLLTQQLVRIVERRQIAQTVSRVVQAQLADQPNATLIDVLHDRKDGRRHREL